MFSEDSRSGCGIKPSNLQPNFHIAVLSITSKMVALNFTALSSVIGLTGGAVRLIADFQGNFLNLAFSDTNDGTPIITTKVTGTINENTVVSLPLLHKLLGCAFGS